MEQTISKINAMAAQFAEETAKAGNKAAAKRARKASLELEKLLKQYRKESVQ